MKYIHYLTAILSASFLNFVPCAGSDEVALAGAETGKWTMDYESAVKLAGEKKLPMLLNFTGSDWCGWCKLMDKNVFAAEPWKKYASDKVVLVTIDFPKDKSIVPEDFVARNAKLKDQFQIRGYPTYMVIESDGKTVLGQLGAGRDKTPEVFIKEFENVVRFSAANIEAYATANPDRADAFKAAIADLKKVEGELKTWIGTGPKKNEENNKIYTDFQSRLQAAAAKLDEFK